MIQKKLNKHLLILSWRLNEKSQLKKITSYKNETLQKVIESYQAVKLNQKEKKDDISFAKCENYRSNLLNDNSIVSYEVFNSDKNGVNFYISLQKNR